MESMKITCQNCGSVAAEVLIPDRPDGVPLPSGSAPILTGAPARIVGSWMDDARPPRGQWDRPAELYAGFSRWWMAEGGAPLGVPSQRAFSAALVALGWEYRHRSSGREYTRPR